MTIKSHRHNVAHQLAWLSQAQWEAEQARGALQRSYPVQLLEVITEHLCDQVVGARKLNYFVRVGLLFPEFRFPADLISLSPKALGSIVLQ